MATKFITVSIEIMHDKNLTPNQKFILAEIHQLSQLDKGCIASNKHFSDLIGITTMGVSKALHDLEQKEYIFIDNSQTKRNFGRVITINSGKSDINSGKSDINSGKSDINSGLESKENKTINKTNNTYDVFINFLKDKCKYKSKITKSKDGKDLFNQIQDKKQLVIDYLKHQEDKKEFAVRITKFMEDYNTVYKNQDNSLSHKIFGEYSE